MNTLLRIAATGLLSLSLPTAALAQDPPTPPAHDQPATPHDQTPPPPTPPIQGAPEATSGGDPGLTVATVKMAGGIRASKMIGAAVIGENNQEIGTLSDLILDKEGKAIMGIISVGSVLGLGGKLVAQPYGQFQMAAGGKLSLPGANKDSMAKQPGFTYSEQ